MERLSARTQGPVLLTYDGPADLAFEKEVQRVNYLSFGLSEINHQLGRAQNIFNPLTLPEEKMRFGLNIVSRIVSRIKKNPALDPLSTLKPFSKEEMERAGMIFRRKTYPEPRLMQLTEQLTLEQVVQNLEIALHDLRNPLSTFTGLTQLSLRRSNSAGIEWDRLRNSYHRVRGFIDGWEEDLKGEFRNENLPVDRLEVEASTIFKDTLLKWLMEEKGMSDEQAEKRVGEILKIVPIPDDQKGLVVSTSIKRFQNLNENIIQNQIRRIEETGIDNPVIIVQLGYNDQNKNFEETVDNNLGEWDPKMNFRFRRRQSYSGTKGAQGLGMAGVVRGMDYTLLNNDMGGATQIYRFKVVRS